MSVRELEAESARLTAAPVGVSEGAVIEESQWGAIRSLRQRGLSKKAIARQLGLDVKTVRRWLKESWRPQRRRRRGQVLDRWSGFLKGRSPEVGFNGEVLLRELREQGYRGSYASVSRYIRSWREKWRGELAPTVRFETEPGEQAQVDWGSCWVWVGEDRVRVHVFVMVLGFSRRLFARAYGHERLGSLLAAHGVAFEHFGGCPRTILYDNPRTIVRDKDEATGTVMWNPAFKDRLETYGIEPRLCRYYRAQTKGKVESGVKYVKRNALAGRRFRDLEDLNAWLLRWALEVADERVHGTTGERPVERFARAEAQALAPLVRPVPASERLEHRIVPRDGFVALDTNRYPVPLAWAGRQAEVHCRGEEVLVRVEGEEPVRHELLSGRNQVGRWRGEPRRVPDCPELTAAGPPRHDPAYLVAAGDVEIRSLELYEALSAGGAR
jgi:transposase